MKFIRTKELSNITSCIKLNYCLNINFPLPLKINENINILVSKTHKLSTLEGKINCLSLPLGEIAKSKLLPKG